MRIKNMNDLTDHGVQKLRRDVVAILEQGLTACDPYGNTRELVRIEEDTLIVDQPDFEPSGAPQSGRMELALQAPRRIFVFGAGKGIHRVVEALEDALGDRLTAGCVLIKHGDATSLSRIEVVHGAHPVPDECCVEGCRKMVAMIRDARLTADDVVFTIVGNGVSSLLTLPAEGLSLEEVKEVTRVLQIECGAPTEELNNVRNAVDQLKGGRLTRLLRPAKMIHLLAIDSNRVKNEAAFEGYDGLMENNCWLHTLPDCTSAEKALDVIERYGTRGSMPANVIACLEHPPASYAPLRRDEFEGMDCRIFGVLPDRFGALPSAMAEAERLGYAPHLLNRGNSMDAVEVGKFVANMALLIAAEEQPFVAPCALFLGGEKVVTVGKNGGIGGRNQEFCLAVAGIIDGNGQIAAGSVDTDGTDGPGGEFDPAATTLGIQALAGAVVDGASKACATALGYALPDVLQRHDTSKPLWDMKDGVWAEHGVSVLDLTVVLVAGPVRVT